MSSEAAAAELFTAVEQNDVQRVRALLAAAPGAVRARLPPAGRTALHLAALAGRCELARALLERGADVDAADAHGLLPLQLAAERYHMPVVKLLLAGGSAGREHAARFLNSDEVEEWFGAAAAGDAARARRLLDAGVPVDCEDRSAHRRTALAVAAERGHRELARLLLARGADPAHVDGCDETPYHIAVNNDHDDIAAMLLESGHPDDRADRDD